MQLFSKEQINLKRKDQTRELTKKNERLATSLRKVIALQSEVDLDQDKAKKVKDYQVWCEDIQIKMSKTLSTLKAYEKLADDKKEEYYALVEKLDEIDDKIIDRNEEIVKLDLQIRFKEELLKK